MFKEINDIVAILNKGGVILYPTDTIWGIGCDATNEAAVARVFDIKKRALNKSMIVLLPDEKSILKYVANPHPDIIEILKTFTTPTTVIYNDGLGFAKNVLAQDGSIGIRITKDGFCKTLLKRFGKPLVSSSANISGGASPTLFKDIHQDLLSVVDYVVQYRQDDETFTPPSTIVRFDENGMLVKLR